MIRWPNCSLAITSLLDRSPARRLGRAVLSQPRVLLMDEPLATPDRRANREIFSCLKCLNEKLAVPMIYISHDMAEIDDHLEMMERGTITATGPLHTLQSDPALPLAAGHEAAISFDAVVGDYDGRYRLLILRLKVHAFWCRRRRLHRGVQQGLRIAASDVSVSREAPLKHHPQCLSGACYPLGASEITLVLALRTGGSGIDILARIRFAWDQGRNGRVCPAQACLAGLSL